MSLSKSFANHIICYHNKLNIMTFLFFFKYLTSIDNIQILSTRVIFGVSVNRDRDFKIITKMAASMRHNFIKPIIPMYAHNMHFRNKSSNANSTNEMKNPKENAGHYFHPRKIQKYKKVQGSSIGEKQFAAIISRSETAG